MPERVSSPTPALALSAVPFTLRALSTVTRLLPPVRGSGRLALSLASRLHRGQGMRVLPIWAGVRMMVDPSDCLGRLLAFVPHLYDRWERQAIAAILRPGDVFVDVGSNIGAYALWAARCLGSSGCVLAIEPEDENYQSLVQNIRLNGLEDRITTVHCGVNDQRQVLPMHRNVTGNRGGHNFMGIGMEGPAIECFPLDEILESVDICRPRMMKLDIEGFERRVLERYFSRVRGNALPEYLLVEIDGGPAPEPERRLLRRSLSARGYRAVREGLNTLYVKDVAES